jgi:hypothetical protein
VTTHISSSPRRVLEPNQPNPRNNFFLRRHSITPFIRLTEPRQFWSEIYIVGASNSGGLGTRIRGSEKSKIGAANYWRAWEASPNPKLDIFFRPSINRQSPRGFAHWADLELSGPISTKKRELLVTHPPPPHLPTHHSNTPHSALSLFSLVAHVKNFPEIDAALSFELSESGLVDRGPSQP